MKKLQFLQDVNVTREETLMYYKKFTSKVKMSIEMSGKITCTACNVDGCDISIETIFVSGNNDFCSCLYCCN